jgi:hypothetical protein
MVVRHLAGCAVLPVVTVGPPVAGYVSLMDVILALIADSNVSALRSPMLATRSRNWLEDESAVGLPGERADLGEISGSPRASFRRATDRMTWTSWVVSSSPAALAFLTTSDAGSPAGCALMKADLFCFFTGRTLLRSHGGARINLGRCGELTAANHTPGTRTPIA